MKLAIEKWEGKDGFERYLSFLQEAHRHYELSVTHVLRKKYHNLLCMARPSFLRHLFELHPFESIYTRAAKYFSTEWLRRVFTFGSMYMGMSPFDAPGTYSLLQYTELAEGIWYPKGGFHKVSDLSVRKSVGTKLTTLEKVVDGLVNIGQRLGVIYRLSSPVSSIILSYDQRSATGVQLENGERLDADIVVCNADLIYTYNNLLPASSYATSLSKRSTSCSSISFYWALNQTVPELRVHNIFLANAYRESFDNIFKNHLIPKEPSFYVNVPSRVDSSAAPAGCDSVVVLVPVGHLVNSKSTPNSSESPVKGDQDWPNIITLARSQVIDTIRSRIGVDIEPLIVHEQVNDPLVWESKFNLDRGAILGLSHSFFNVLSFRPKTQHPSIKGLYFVGASTHPGTGVPICLAGAKIVANQVLTDQGMEVPWADGGVHIEGDGKGIDAVESRLMFSIGFWNLLLIIGLVSVTLLYASGSMLG